MAHDGRIIARVRAVQAYHDCNGSIKAAAQKLCKQGVLLGGQEQFVRRWVKRAESGQSMLDNVRSGRPRQLSNQAVSRARQLLTETRYSCAKTAVTLKAEGLCPKGVSASTIRRAARAADSNITFKSPRVVPKLTEAQKQARLKFARANRRRGWGNVMFTDSKYFRLGPARGGSGNKKWMLKDSTETIPAVKYPPTVHAYAGVTKYGKTELFFSTGTTGLKNGYEKGNRGVAAQEYVEQVLSKCIVPTARSLLEKRGILYWQLQQDGARAHTAKHTTGFLQQAHVNVLPNWPANSPDLSWIENLWGIVDRELRKQNYSNFEQFCEELRRIWDEVPCKTLVKLEKSMRRRMELCIELKGEHIGY